MPSPHLYQGAQAAAEREHGGQQLHGLGVVQQRLQQAPGARELVTVN